MSHPLRVLILEDNAAETALILRELRRAGFDPCWQTAETKREYSAHLDLRPEVILADHSLSHIGVLDLLEERGLDIPVIFLAGQATSLEEAVEGMKRGAADYIRKDRLGNMGPALQEALGKSRLRREKQRADGALRRIIECYGLALRATNDEVWAWDLAANKMYVAPHWKDLGKSKDEEIESTQEEWLKRIHPRDLVDTKAALAAHLGGQVPHFFHECRIRQKDGGFRWILLRGLAVRDPSGKPIRVAGTCTDISKYKEVERQLLHDAFHDPLTGLPNRALFLDRLELCFLRGKRDPSTLYAVLFVDLDGFKSINDSLGHPMGDQLLVQVGKRLVQCLRPGDTAARLGGDEFAILLENIRNPGSAVAVVERIRRQLLVPFNLDGCTISVTASIGVAFSGDRYERADDILADADRAMYRAKGLGKARYEVFDPAHPPDSGRVSTVVKTLFPGSL